MPFGVFNRIDKISDDAIRVWSKLMREVTGSKIIIKHTLLDDPLRPRHAPPRGSSRKWILEENITCLGSSDAPEHLRAFEQVDISLDPFPQRRHQHLGIPLCGLPVVAKLGIGASSRAGACFVTAVGLDDWVAEDDDGYVEIGCKFASQPDHLAKSRVELPALIAASPAGCRDLHNAGSRGLSPVLARLLCVDDPVDGPEAGRGRVSARATPFVVADKSCVPPTHCRWSVQAYNFTQFHRRPKAMADARHPRRFTRPKALSASDAQMGAPMLGLVFGLNTRLGRLHFFLVRRACGGDAAICFAITMSVLRDIIAGQCSVRGSSKIGHHRCDQLLGLATLTFTRCASATLVGTRSAVPARIALMIVDYIVGDPVSGLDQPDYPARWSAGWSISR